MRRKFGDTLVQIIRESISRFLGAGAYSVCCSGTSVTLDTCEKIFGSLCIALMIFVVHRNAALFSVSGDREKLFFTLSVVALFANFFGWALYFTGHQSIFVMMLFIVAMPPLYYIAIGLWRLNMPLAVTGAIFLVIHFIHVLTNLSGSSQ